jgi:uncharacterized integral membrane protein
MAVRNRPTPAGGVPGNANEVIDVWIIKGLLFLALLFVLVYFFVTNANQTVDINLFGRMYLDVSIYWVAMVSFMIGFAMSFLLAMIREMHLRGEIRGLKKDNRDKEREIADLRALPLQNLADSGPHGSEGA